jgi:hypothetical protein
VPRLQALWQRVSLQVAAVAPKDQLLDLLADLADGLTAEDCALLGISDGGAWGAPSARTLQPQDSAPLLPSRLAMLQAVLDVSVGAGLAADAVAGSVKLRSKTAARAAAAAAAAGVGDVAASFVHAFSVADCAELLGLLADLQLSAGQLKPLLAASVSVLSGAITAAGPAYGLPCSAVLFEDDRQPGQVGDDEALLDAWASLGFKLPKRVDARLEAWVDEQAAAVEAQDAAAAAATAAAAAAAGPPAPYGGDGGALQDDCGRRTPQQQHQQLSWQQQSWQQQSWQQDQQQAVHGSSSYGGGSSSGSGGGWGP